MALNLIINPNEDTTFYDSVRRILGGIDEETLPNDVIVDPAIFDLAEMEILSLVPCIETGELPPADLQKARLAMIYLIASKLCQTAKGLVEYEAKTIDVSWKKKPIDYDVLEDDLIATADSILSTISCYDSVDRVLLKLAPSRRTVEEENAGL